MSIENKCVDIFYGYKYALQPAPEIVKSIRNLLADAVVQMCPHPVTESVVCDACLHAAFVVRSA
jgi:hypothetical protein